MNKIMVRLGAGVASISLALISGAASATDYTVLTMGKPAGSLTITAQEGERTAVYLYNDRGRGQQLKEVAAVDDSGLIRRLSVTGLDYYRSPVNESFSIEGAQAKWVSQADSGEGAKNAFYLAFDQTPEDMAMLVRAAIKTPDQNIELLPGGKAKVRRLLEREVSSASGDKERVALYSVAGVNLEPQTVWLDSKNDLFFSGSTWTATVRKGWEQTVPELVRAQDEELRKGKLASAQRVTRKPAGAFAIRHANLFDAASKSMNGGMTVVVRNNRIEAVGPDGKVPIPQGAELIDATGQALLPGFWDMHVHTTSDTEGLLNIGNGVTSTRDLGTDADELALRKKNFDSGALVGPRIFRAVLIESPSPVAGPTKVIVSTPEEMAAAVHDYANRGYEQIKIYSAVKPKLLPIAIKTAHERGLRVSGHIPTGISARDAVNLGFDEINHIQFVLANFIPELLNMPVGMKRTFLFAEKAAAMDFKSKEVTDFISLLKQKDVVIDPTLAIYESLYTGGPGLPYPSLAMIRHRLPPATARIVMGGALPADEQLRSKYRATHQKMLELTAALYRAGVRIVAGTDDFAGFSLHREIELLVKAGIPNLDALYIATLGAAKVGKHDGELGSIEPGKCADLVLVKGDPSKNISDIRNTSLVVKDGLIYDPKAVLAEINIRS